MPVAPSTTILHVDLDAFFAAVEQRDHPELRGRPVIVGGAPGSRGVVSAASYEARRYGVRSAMPLRTAAALCPEGVFVPVRGDRYAEVSRAFMVILRRWTPLVEQISIDEAFLDVAGTFALHGTPERIAEDVRAAVGSELGLTASVGVASTRLVAKIASDLRKPDGLVVVPAGTEAAFLQPLPIWRLWGVGEQTRRALADYGVQTIGDLAVLPPDVLVRRFGAHGMTLAERARGIDPTPVGNDEVARTVSHEHTFDRDTRDPEVIERTLLALAEGVGSRLRDGGVKAATVGVKIRDSHFSTHTRQRTLPEPTDQVDDIFRVALALARPEIRAIEVRLLGVVASNLTEREQLSLFPEVSDRRRLATAAADRIRHRYGPGTIVRARLLAKDVPEPFARDHLHAPEAPRVGRRSRPDIEREPTNDRSEDSDPEE
jgi:DNA polymerase-4